MRVIGLTGGIGSGKSTVTNYIKNLGILVIDADKISREITGINGEALPDIRREFGDSVFNLDGSLNRKELSKIVFNNKEKLEILEKYTTDVVNKKIIHQIEELRNSNYEGIVLLDIPLLFESNDDSFCDETWVVTCDFETRVNRIIKRDNTIREDVIKRINSQLSDEEKIKRATYVLDNSYNKESLYEQIDDILSKNVCNY